jgi:hypothetical protein
LLFERFPRFQQFGLFKARSGKNRDALAFKIFSHVPSGSR